MRVVGGAYYERCLEPRRNDRVGSGVRAACVLKAADPDVVLTTALSADERGEFDPVLAGTGVATEVVRRDERVGFSYFTPLSAPAVTGGKSRHDGVSATAESVLLFGLIEAGEVNVEAHSLVLDPQQPRDLVGLDLERIRFDRLAIVANRAETLALAGGDARDDVDLANAARKLIEIYGAEVVITKRAARGALVTTADEVAEVGVFCTPRVYPIGSGDVFAAGFAWAWCEQELAPREAARIASRLAAAWCERGALSIPIDYFGSPNPEDELAPIPAQVYLAAPFFSLGELWMVELVRDTLLNLGADVFSPWHEIGPGGDEVAHADLEGLASCDSVLALIDGHDPGTLFELGWARAIDIPVVAFAHHAHLEGSKMLRGTDAEVHADLSTAVYRAIWAGMERRGA